MPLCLVANHLAGRLTEWVAVQLTCRYTILEDATGVDMELERLRRENHLRMIKLHPGDVGLIETATYNTRVRASSRPSASRVGETLVVA